jgi:hypothetical protein
MHICRNGYLSGHITLILQRAFTLLVIFFVLSKLPKSFVVYDEASAIL